MKNKIIASVLAVCLFVGMAVPAFAITSTQSGVDSDITMTEFVKNEYEVKNGNSIDMRMRFNSYASTKQLVQDSTITWEIKNTTEGTYPFNIDNNGLVYCSEDKGTAEIIATVTGKDEKKFTVKTKLTAKPADNVRKATGYTFENGKISPVVGQYVTATEAYMKDGANSVQTFKVKPYPKDSAFTKAQADKIATILGGNVDLAVVGKDKNGGEVTVIPTATAGDDITLSYANGAVTSQSVAYTIAGTAIKDGSLTIDGISVPYKNGDVATSVASSYKAKFDLAKASTNYASVTDNAGILTFTNKTGVTANPDATVTKDAGITATKAAPTTMITTGGLAAIAYDVNAPRAKQISVVEFPNYQGDNTSTARASVSISAKVAAPVERLNAGGSVTLEVGERKSIEKMFQQSPSGANVKYTLSDPTNDFLDSTSEYSEYAVPSGNVDDKFEIIGVAVGVNRIQSTITLANGEKKEASIVVNVIEKGKKVDPDAKKASLAFDKATVDVGKSVVLAIKDAPTDAATKFVSSDAKIAKVDGTGKITGVAAGNATITVTVGDQTLKAEITVKGAAPVVPEEKPVAPVVPVVPNKPTINPSTGVALLGQLF